MSRVLLATAALTACAVSPSDNPHASAWVPAGSDPLPPPGLTLEVPSFDQGGPVDLRVIGAQPYEQVTLLGTRSGLGDGPCPPQIGGQCLDVAPPLKLVGQGTTDSRGNLTFPLNVPASPPPSLALQAVAVRGPDPATSLYSNAVLATAAVRGPSCVVQDAWNANADYNDLTMLGGDVFAMKYTAPGPMTVSRLEVFTGEEQGTNRLEIYSHDAGADEPGALLASGSWPMGTTNAWQGADLDSNVSLVGGDVVWLVWHPVADGQANWAVSGTDVTYKASTDGGATWTGPYTAPMMARLYVCP